MFQNLKREFIIECLFWRNKFIMKKSFDIKKMIMVLIFDFDNTGLLFFFFCFVLFPPPRDSGFWHFVSQSSNG
jgi:hypothetical protein